MEKLDWSYSFFKWSFVTMGIFTALMIPFCYLPNHIAELLGKFGTTLLGLPIVKIATADHSGASLICITLAFLALAHFSILQKRRAIQGRILEKFYNDLRESGQKLQTLSKILPKPDPVGAFLREIYKEKRSGDTALELLHRHLQREDARFRQAITPLVVIGLLGTLIGVFIGFITTFGAEQELQLHTALHQAVVVVATACL